ncbi:MULTISPECIES: cation:proton antiporter [unclassified Meiothermus]|uniref:cation:proton antiporter n=1 Tax=unclassified Meiothermus TaxID=370471 RepID=UPI000D7C5E55|nr:MULTISPECIES: cation:proton antiporter [unclassified Meiothermus]PZA07220.1 cation:proton antiporter [Meiothermus sp. Pnk-1]RYM40073.1 cation:proton antiporter [Meiothermus sp. PNK-Is4]
MHPSVEAFALAAALLALGAALVHRLRFPPLPAYLLVGLVLGGRLDVEALEPLPSLGLLLLLFSVGLEFGPDRLGQLSQRVLRAGCWDALALPLGAGLGALAGLDWRGAWLLGGIVYASSSAVIVKLILDLRRATSPESEVVLGVLVFEDLLIAVLLVLLSGQGGIGLLATVGLALCYWLIARWMGPRLSQAVERFSNELVLLAGAALVSGSAALFHLIGASESVGAFLCGVVAAGLGLRERLEHLFGPVRDLGVALFFLTVGAQALGLLQGAGWLAAGLAIAGLLLKLPLNLWGAKEAGLGPKRQRYAAVYLLPRGEFNLVLGALALQGGYPLAAQVAVMLVLVSIPLGSVLMRYAPDWFGKPRSSAGRVPRRA